MKTWSFPLFNYLNQLDLDWRQIGFPCVFIIQGNTIIIFVGFCCQPQEIVTNFEQYVESTLTLPLYQYFAYFKFANWAEL